MTTREPLMYAFAPEELVVVVHVEGAAYSFAKNCAPMADPRTTAVIRALLNAAIGDLDAQVHS